MSVHDSPAVINAAANVEDSVEAAAVLYVGGSTAGLIADAPLVKVAIRKLIDAVVGAMPCYGEAPIEDGPEWIIGGCRTAFEVPGNGLCEPCTVRAARASSPTEVG